MRCRKNALNIELRWDWSEFPSGEKTKHPKEINSMWCKNKEQLSVGKSHTLPPRDWCHDDARDHYHDDMIPLFMGEYPFVCLLPLSLSLSTAFSSYRKPYRFPVSLCMMYWDVPCRPQFNNDTVTIFIPLQHTSNNTCLYRGCVCRCLCVCATGISVMFADVITLPNEADEIFFKYSDFAQRDSQFSRMTLCYVNYAAIT